MTAPLLVPVQLQALLVNPNVRAQGFQRWTMDYTALDAFASPEPAPFAGLDPTWASSSANDGVHLQWTLPSALRRGVHDPATGVTTYPLVPNRWLVLRIWGPATQSGPARRSCTGWIVESDHLGTDGTSAYLDPAAATPTPVQIGRALPLATWTETGTRPLFLTALAPGNVAFASYQPYGAGVFSFHDQAAGLSTGTTVSYLVAGWYSDPSADILAAPTQTGGFAARLADLGWSAKGPQTATSTLFHGAICTLAYSTTAVGNRPTAIAVAVGNTSVDAMTAMIRAQAARQPELALHPDLIEAFQYDLLRTLDDVDGPARLQAQIHEAWFAAHPGGSVWQVVSAPPTDSVQAAEQEQGEGGPVAQPAWLAALNQAQTAYDDAVQVLAALQRQLYDVWWKRGRANAMSQRPAGLTDAQFAAALDPSQQDSVAAQVVARTAQVTAARAAIPWGATQAALATAITAYTQQHPLPPGTELKRADRPAFRAPADPVVVIAGAHADAFNDDLGTTAAGLLPCRFPDQTVVGLELPPLDQGTSNPVSGPGPGPQPQFPPIRADQELMGDYLPTANLAALPTTVAALPLELFFLDPDNAATIGAVAASAWGQPAAAAQLATQTRQMVAAGQDVLGMLPAIRPQTWAQPWAPLFLEWQVAYRPIPYGPSWQFDGSQYTWSGQGAQPAGPISLSGRSLLMPQPSFTFKARLDAYLATSPDADLAAVENFVASVDNWDLLSQALSGFTAQLSLRDPASLRAPDATTVIVPPSTTMATLVGGGAGTMPMADGAQVAAGGAPLSGSGWQALRAGQFAFTRLSVVDRFGQSLDVVAPATAAAFTPVIAEGLAPQTEFAGPPPTARYIQLPPRLLQPARWDIAFTPSVADGLAAPSGEPNPVGAWILPSALDGALACYDPAGNALGEVALTAAATGGTQVSWLPAPGSTRPTISTLTSSFPDLAAFLGGLVTAGPAAFADLMTTIDATLWTIDPPGTGDETYLSVLAGRPLALARTSVRGEPAGPPATDPAWQYTFAPQASPVSGYTFPVRLGDAALRGDGLIGYLAEPDYGHFHAAYLPEGLTSTYVEAIGPGSFISAGFGTSAPAYVTLLLDPKVPVHLTSDILPTTAIHLPQRFVADALAAMALNIRFGPILTDILQPAGDAPPAVLLPRPTELDGTWSWAETDATGATVYDITPIDAAVRFPATAPTLRTGWLRLTGGLQPPQE